MIYLQLLWSFVKIGFTSFGGMSMIPLISSEMASHGWMTLNEISDIVAIAEMTPGPLGLNCATFCGLRTAGIFGAIVSNLGVLSPTLTLGLLAAVGFEKFKKNPTMQHVLVGVRPACVGMVFGVAISLMQTNFIVNESLNPFALGIAILDFVLIYKFKWSVPKIIGISAVLGLVFFGVL